MIDRSQLLRLRVLMGVWVVLLGVSVGLLLWASTLAVEITPGTLTWQGVTDVAAALTLVMLGAILVMRAQPVVGREALRLAYGAATVLVPLMLLGMWLNAGRLLWNVLLVGLAWRTWLLLYVLPAAIAVWRPSRRKARTRASDWV